MKALAEALVETAAFLELTGDDLVNPDAAVRAHEAIVSTLANASEEERDALLKYCYEQAAALAETRTTHEQRRRDFYLTFAIAFGLTDE